MDCHFLEMCDCVFRFETDAHDGVEFARSLGLSKATTARLLAQGRLKVSAGFAEITALRRELHPHELYLQELPARSISAPAAPQSMVPAQILSVLYEDAFLLAADKPAKLLVHGDGSQNVTLSDLVALYLVSKGELFSPQAVQRLDFETTGVVLFSKVQEFQSLFDALVEDHGLLKKEYLAVVEGEFPARLETIGTFLGRDRHDARRMRVSSGTGKPARTFVELLDVSGGYSLLRLTLGSGRKHQLRVHLSWRGFPIVGDTLYGAKPCENGLLLHAYRESGTHPILHEPFCIRAPLPPGFRSLFCDIPNDILD